MNVELFGLWRLLGEIVDADLPFKIADYER